MDEGAVQTAQAVAGQVCGGPSDARPLGNVVRQRRHRLEGNSAKKSGGGVIREAWSWASATPSAVQDGLSDRAERWWIEVSYVHPVLREAVIPFPHET